MCFKTQFEMNNTLVQTLILAKKGKNVRMLECYCIKSLLGKQDSQLKVV